MPAPAPSNSDFRPHLSGDADYLSKVSDTIRGTDNQESINFGLLNNALQKLGVNEDPYKLVSLQNLSPEELNEIIERSFTAIQDADEETLEFVKSLWDYLATEDEIKSAELAFVFGGPNPQRAQIAIDLYKSGKVKKILFTGKHASYIQAADLTEAEMYAKMAIDQGVPESNIITENEAKNTPENAANSAKLLKDIKYLPKTTVAITLPYHMMRSYFTLKAATEAWHPHIYRKVAPSAKFNRDNFYLDSNGWSYIFNEFIKLYGARLMRHF